MREFLFAGEAELSTQELHILLHTQLRQGEAGAEGKQVLGGDSGYQGENLQPAQQLCPALSYFYILRNQA